MKTSKEDTVKINTLNALAKHCFNTDPAKANEHSQKALVIAKKLNFTHGILISFDNIARYYWMTSDYPNALKF